MLSKHRRAELSFTLGDEIGQEGKNSQVFLSQDHQLDSQLVIKAIKKEDFTHQDEFFVEARILHLSSHPNVVPIHYACEDQERVFLAMPYYAKGSLKKLINEQFLTLREIITYASQFLSGLHNIHSKGLLHFDVKPDNILISEANQAVLSDFGLAKHMDRMGTATAAMFYPVHVPPEAFTDDQFTVAYDIYQAGVTLYRMCNGDELFYKQQQAFRDDDEFFDAVANGSFPDRRVFLEHIPSRVKNIILRCLDVDPEKRPSSVIEIVNQLAFVEGLELDWRFSLNGSERVWSKSVEGRLYQLKLDLNGNSNASKTINGVERKIHAYCQNPINAHNIRAFLRTY